ncbi:MaoC family dehydratase [Flexivirga oryzae]|uniref:Acyl dehydratase n=1 Tax=Flexivirga oryzae TaxID=1794944 RepID=A0A839NGU9_9MICO|nr:MaoC family dehydratase [Flexivirga oryzae]MBB2893652.1 acyl dehydratase [Flexivirga oryzae]
MTDTDTQLPVRVTIAELPSLVGTTVGTAPAIEVTQERINAFAEATEDRQWIHTDPERARSGPFGTTIAHGYLTLSLASALMWEVLQVTDAAQVVNYGLEKVRFPAPVPAGSPVSMTLDIVSVEPVAGGVQVRYRGTFTVPDNSKPVCVTDGLFRYYEEQ